MYLSRTPLAREATVPQSRLPGYFCIVLVLALLSISRKVNTEIAGGLPSFHLSIAASIMQLPLACSVANSGQGRQWKFGVRKEKRINWKARPWGQRIVDNVCIQFDLEERRHETEFLGENRLEFCFRCGFGRCLEMLYDEDGEVTEMKNTRTSIGLRLYQAVHLRSILTSRALTPVNAYSFLAFNGYAPHVLYVEPRSFDDIHG
ncbi:hypothetical protein DFS33DRAFT_1387884 [Desarmillaria ectypa]|nr:hypothetical protein DFS33DRAFT_1387884 [Desarmillaria ectypa]